MIIVASRSREDVAKTFDAQVTTTKLITSFATRIASRRSARRLSHVDISLRREVAKPVAKWLARDVGHGLAHQPLS